MTEGDAEAVAAVARSGLLLGDYDDEGLAALLTEGPEHCFFFPSGREALRAALNALYLPPGGEVVVQTYVCDAVTWAIRACGLVPVYCDLDRGWTSSPDSVRAIVSSRSVAIILAPPFGFEQPARDYRTFGLPILADRCQSAPHASRYDADADLNVLSFHPTKYVTGAGGGAVVTRDRGHFDALRDAAHTQSVHAPWSNLQKELLRSQLVRLEAFEQRRSRLFCEFLKAVPRRCTGLMEERRTVPPGRMFRFVVEIDEPFEALRSKFAAAGVVVRRGVDALAHRLDGLGDASYPIATARFDRTLSLPFHPSLTADEASRVAAVAGGLL